ncbi:MAG TPA: MBL fold metallo-hydrolase [Candidatus Paceibacterota bacterium]|jgi:L-ascorbate metabolism protein UlaG (beta-lactamase superfamily)|nr:MBL fold metallo-hydrolase [Candidatus Paceibacterota bacterium]
MVITYFGKSYFKLTLGDLTIAINPPTKESKAFSKPPRFGADIALITTHTPDTDGADTVSLGDKEPFIIDGPGNYEVRDLLFTGASSTVTLDKKVHINTVYGFELDGIKIAFIGLIDDEKKLSPDAVELASNADMVFMPVASGVDLDPAKAYKIATSFDPNVIIPYEYDAASLKQFLKEGGQEKNEPQDKATLKRKDLDGKEGYILLLDPQA